MRSAKNLKPGDRLQSFPGTFSSPESRWETALVISVTPKQSMHLAIMTTKGAVRDETPYIVILTDRMKLVEYTAFWCKANCCAFSA